MIAPASKARTLKQLESKVSLFKIPAFLYFEARSFAKAPQAVVSQITDYFHNQILAVRSSAADEDGTEKAHAGAYDSVLGVPSRDTDTLLCAIQKVITSYDRHSPRLGIDEFIVQEMLQNTAMSGVVFTHDLNTGAPYYVINYDDISGLTNTVTSGGGEYANRTLYIHRGATEAIRSERFQKLIAAIQELEKVMGSQFLDVEFALGQDFTPYLLQTRAITTQPNWNRAVAKRIDSALQGIQALVKARLQPMAGVYGKTTVLGQMPDWNPAEMIGRAPRALAFSLYETLITNHAWRRAREIMGYSVPAGQPLMISLGGQPFIDTRLSFHSYLPAGLKPEIAQKLVDAWVKRLASHPELHDKVEFEVAITTYSFDLDEKLEKLVGTALNAAERKEFKDLLRQQTLTLVSDSGEGGITKALEKIETLVKKQAQLRGLPAKQEISALLGMIDDCERFGTVPFSILARHGFIARTILLSLQNRGLLTGEEVLKLQSAVHTVASDLVDDVRRLQRGELSRDDFMAKYGHLRPGTYDILSPRYDMAGEFGTAGSQAGPIKEIKKFVLSPEKKAKIDQLFKAEGFIGVDSEKFLHYFTEATAGREYGKFIFTRSISEMLELIAGFGEVHGLSREEMSHISVSHLISIATTSNEGSVEDRLRAIAEDEAEKHAVSAAIRLPQVLMDEAGVHVVPFQVSHPNFITNDKITAPCVVLEAGQTSPPLLTGKIVLIENADPGFDWIFAQQISGLITKYGGANSHMAIRCAEFCIPAAIGCGEQRFEALIGANQILLDCAAGLITPLH